MKKRVISSDCCSRPFSCHVWLQSGKRYRKRQKAKRRICRGYGYRRKGYGRGGNRNTRFLLRESEYSYDGTAKEYQKDHPNVKIIYNADSSGTLLTQIEEGYECDLFFSAAQKQMDVLEADGFLVDGTRSDVVNNQVVVITLKDSKTKVKGLANLQDAESIALAGGSVPVGKYTRQALVNMGIIHTSNDPDSITAQEISEAFGGVEISEQDNVSKVLMAVAEGSCEVGTTYYSDIYGYEDDIKILEKVSSDLTGDVIYPIAQIVNKEADKKQTEAAEDFMDFLLSDEAAKVFESYYFDTDIK